MVMLRKALNVGAALVALGAAGTSAQRSLRNLQEPLEPDTTVELNAPPVIIIRNATDLDEALDTMAPTEVFEGLSGNMSDTLAPEDTAAPIDTQAPFDEEGDTAAPMDTQPPADENSGTPEEAAENEGSTSPPFEEAGGAEPVPVMSQDASVAFATSLSTPMLVGTAACFAILGSAVW